VVQLPLPCVVSQRQRCTFLHASARFCTLLRTASRAATRWRLGISATLRPDGRFRSRISKNRRLRRTTQDYAVRCSIRCSTEGRHGQKRSVVGASLRAGRRRRRQVVATWPSNASALCQNALSQANGRELERVRLDLTRCHSRNPGVHRLYFISAASLFGLGSQSTEATMLHTVLARTLSLARRAARSVGKTKSKHERSPDCQVCSRGRAELAGPKGQGYASRGIPSATSSETLVMATSGQVFKAAAPESHSLDSSHPARGGSTGTTGTTETQYQRASGVGNEGDGGSGSSLDER
jgi:hypothetical protein